MPGVATSSAGGARGQGGPQRGGSGGAWPPLPLRARRTFPAGRGDLAPRAATCLAHPAHPKPRSSLQPRIDP
jgi:hypothetical protein